VDLLGAFVFAVGVARTLVRLVVFSAFLNRLGFLGIVVPSMELANHTLLGRKVKDKVKHGGRNCARDRRQETRPEADPTPNREVPRKVEVTRLYNVLTSACSVRGFAVPTHILSPHISCPT
jgi:hypothetical protein